METPAEGTGRAPRGASRGPHPPGPAATSVAMTNITPITGRSTRRPGTVGRAGCLRSGRSCTVATPSRTFALGRRSPSHEVGEAALALAEEVQPEDEEGQRDHHGHAQRGGVEGGAQDG